jgi:hypothetical protein
VVHPGRREPILVGVLALDGVVTLAVSGWMVWEVVSKRWSPILLGVAPMLILSFLSAAWMILRSTYQIEGTDLVVRQGPSRRVVPLSAIEEVVPTAGPGLGGRLQVQFAPGAKAPPLLLNPEDREAFLRGLAEADPGLTYDGQKVSRSG